MTRKKANTTSKGVMNDPKIKAKATARRSKVAKAVVDAMDVTPAQPGAGTIDSTPDPKPQADAPASFLGVSMHPAKAEFDKVQHKDVVSLMKAVRSESVAKNNVQSHAVLIAARSYFNGNAAGIAPLWGEGNNIPTSDQWAHILCDVFGVAKVDPDKSEPGTPRYFETFKVDGCGEVTKAEALRIRNALKKTRYTLQRICTKGKHGDVGLSPSGSLVLKGTLACSPEIIKETPANAQAEFIVGQQKNNPFVINHTDLDKHARAALGIERAPRGGAKVSESFGVVDKALSSGDVRDKYEGELTMVMVKAAMALGVITDTIDEIEDTCEVTISVRTLRMFALRYAGVAMEIPEGEHAAKLAREKRAALIGAANELELTLKNEEQDTADAIEELEAAPASDAALIELKKVMNS